MGLEEKTVSQDIDIVDDQDEEWIDDRSKPEVEFDYEQQQPYEKLTEKLINRKIENSKRDR